MAVKVSKPKVNIREKLTELDIPKGVHGTQVIGSQTVGETYDLIRAGRRNLLYNGDMWVNQRGDVTGVTGNQYGGPDRWKSMIASCGTWGISQSTDVPIGQGFKKSLKLDCEANRASLAAGSSLSIAQYIEGHDLAHLRWGYPDAKDLTLSFWLKTDNGVTGTFVVYIRNHGGGTCLNRQVRVRDQGYWNKYVVNIPADRTNQFTYDHSKQLELAFHFDAGTNLGGAASGGSMLNTWISYHAAHTAVGCDLRLASSTGNNLYITGIQLEEGSEPTPFEHLPYAVNLALCQRYYMKRKLYGCVSTGYSQGGGGYDSHLMNLPLPVKMRTAPTVGFENGSATGAFQPGGNTANFGSLASGVDFVSCKTGSTNSTWTTQVVASQSPEVTLDAEL